MDRNVSQIARILGAGAQQVKNWSGLFKEYLSPGSNPPKGQTRVFSDSDFLVLSYIFYHWEPDSDLQEIEAGLNQEEHHEERFMEHLYLHTPIFQEPPDGLDEKWSHGFILNGANVGAYMELARIYRESAETLLETALKGGEAHEWAYPILFSYRHTLELYLKIIGEIDEATHSLRRCVHLVEKRHGHRIGSPVREWIFELNDLDPSGTAFRYADDEANTLTYLEHWVDLVQFEFAMKQVFEMIDNAILRTGAKGRPAQQRERKSSAK